MNVEALSKIVKAGAVLGGLIGINITPEQTSTLIDAVGVILTIAYTVEAWIKTKK